MRKVIGNILLIIGLGSFALMMCSQILDWDIEMKNFALPYVIGLVGGIALRIGDFFKWRAKKHQEGINEARGNSANTAGAAQFCPHCGKPLSSKTAFCPHCGKALD